MRLALDTETTGLRLFKSHAPFAVSAATDAGDMYYWRWEVEPTAKGLRIKYRDKDLAEIRKLAKRADELIFHNAKFDVRGLRKIGVDLTDRWKDTHDTICMSHVFNSGELHGLKPLGVKYLRILDTDETALRESVKKARRSYDGPMPLGEVEECYWMGDPELCKKYALLDAERTIRLFSFYRTRFGEWDANEESSMWENYQTHLQLLPILYGMEETGLYLPKGRLERELARCERARDYAASSIPKGLNLNSPQQLGKHLYETLGLDPRRTEAGNYSSKYEVLLDLQAEATGEAREFIDSLLDFRRFDTAANFLTSYADLEVNRVLHGNINQTGTRGTRFTMSDPNGQQVGKPDEEDPEAPNIRAAIGPRSGYVLVSIDYSQLEGREMAQLSGDPLLSRIYAEGRDWHTETCKAIFGEDIESNPGFKGYRKLAKNINFAKQYGGGATALARYAEGNVARAKEFSRKYDHAYHGVTAFRREATEECSENNGYVFTSTLEGRQGGYKVHPAEYKDAANAKVQGTAGEIVKKAMIEANDYLERFNNGIGGVPPARMLLQIHDEILYEVPKKYYKELTYELAEIMKQAGKPFNTPTGAECYREHWGSGEKIDL